MREIDNAVHRKDDCEGEDIWVYEDGTWDCKCGASGTTDQL